VAFVDLDVPLETQNKMLSFKAKASDSKCKLDRINLYVNDIPIDGISGFSLRDKDVREFTKHFNIELSALPGFQWVAT
jgi:hypothetical protein